jgi:hypothetical protein
MKKLHPIKKGVANRNLMRFKRTLISAVLTFCTHTFVWAEDIIDLAKEIKKQNISYPYTSLAIAMHESGKGKSLKFRRDHNAFGLRGRTHYMKFKTLADCVTRYKITHDKIVKKYNPTTEKAFLNAVFKWGYAEEKTSVYRTGVNNHMRAAVRVLDSL